MDNTLYTRYLHRLFWVSILVKGLDGVLETIGGILVLLASRADLFNIVIFLTAPELAEDPGDLVANYLRHVILNLSSNTKYFASVYLLFNGVVKVLLMIGILRGKLWSYRMALGFIAIFVGYQLYRFSHTHSLVLLGFMLFDVLTLYLIWREYRLRSRAFRPQVRRF
ncbi:MAG: DUF2127 domain-containing protein [Gammaproteobacteria bacterium]|nr:DUF2127 domain-containing protein [Gammaproteobacteria bacterium]